MTKGTITTDKMIIDKMTMEKNDYRQNYVLAVTNTLIITLL